MQEQVQQVLSDCVIDGNVVKITGQQLDRKIYEGVKKALEGIAMEGWEGERLRISRRSHGFGRSAQRG